MSSLHANDLGDEIRALKQRLNALERTPRYTPTAIPSVITGTVHDFGFAGREDTAYGDVFRSDVFATAPVLEFEVQTGTWLGSGITTVHWQIEVTDYVTGASFIVATSEAPAGMTVVDNGSGFFQFAGAIDLFAAMGEEALNRFVRIDVEIKRVGGSGAASIRLIRPLLLRVRDI